MVFIFSVVLFQSIIKVCIWTYFAKRVLVFSFYVKTKNKKLQQYLTTTNLFFGLRFLFKFVYFCFKFFFFFKFFIVAFSFNFQSDKSHFCQSSIFEECAYFYAFSTWSDDLKFLKFCKLEVDWWILFLRGTRSHYRGHGAKCRFGIR